MKRPDEEGPMRMTPPIRPRPNLLGSARAVQG